MSACEKGVKYVSFKCHMNTTSSGLTSFASKLHETHLYNSDSKAITGKPSAVIQHLRKEVNGEEKNADEAEVDVFSG